MMGAFKLEEAWTIFESILQEGLCKSIGISNCQKEHIDRLSHIWSVKPAVNQVSVSSMPELHVPNHVRSNIIPMSLIKPNKSKHSKLAENMTLPYGLTAHVSLSRPERRMVLPRPSSRT
jgi:diketogulonate reductase-like aldo/keto reductase